MPAIRARGIRNPIADILEVEFPTVMELVWFETEAHLEISGG
jgi:hypothetical protein